MFNNSQSGHSIFTRLLLILIIISFCLWGIEDIFRASGTPGSVAKVGNASISMQEFQRSYKAQQEELRQKMGKNFTQEMAKRIGLERRVLDGIISRTALEQEAAAMGIIPSEDNVLDTLAQSSGFLDVEGKFNKEVFMATLRELNLTEQQYLSDIRRQLAAQILLGTITGTIPVADDVVLALHKIRNEKRAVSLLFIPADTAHTPVSATDAEIKAYYDKNLVQFTVPEFRKLSYVELSPDAYQALTNVSDDEIQKAYLERAEEFFHPERRTIEQLVFENKEDADKAAADLATKPIAEVAAASNALNKDKILLGELPKNAVPVAADEVFALPVGGYTKPEKSPFGWHIIHVTKIAKEGRKPLEEVKEVIAAELKAKMGETLLVRQSSQLQDSLGGGATLEDAAKSIGATVAVLDGVSKEGKTAKGDKLAIPYAKSFLEAAFATPEKETSRLIQGETGVYFVVRVDAVNKEHPQPLEEVRAQVAQALQKETDSKAVRALADQIAKDIHSGKKLSETAGKSIAGGFESAGLWPYEAERIDEGKQKNKSIPAALAQSVFKLQPGQTTDAAYALPEGGYVIARLDTIISAPDPKSKEGEEAVSALREGLQTIYEREAQTAYVGYLRRKYPITINDKFLNPPAEPSSENN